MNLISDLLADILRTGCAAKCDSDEHRNTPDNADPKQQTHSVLLYVILGRILGRAEIVPVPSGCCQMGSNPLEYYRLFHLRAPIFASRVSGVLRVKLRVTSLQNA